MRDLAPTHELRVEPEPTIRDFFCWAVQGPHDRTIKLARKQMQLCGGHAVFANISSPERNIIKLYNDSMEVGYASGRWAKNTHIFLAAWEYIARSEWPDQFRWFVKIDADTFLRPRFLPAAVEGMDPGRPIGVLMFKNVAGALEIMSGKTFRSSNTFLLHTRNTELLAREPILLQEDQWMSNAFRVAGFRLKKSPLTHGCNGYLLTYRNLPRPLRGRTGKRKKPTLLHLGRVLNGEFDKPHLKRDCIRRDVLAIHPIKEPDQYQFLIDFDRKLQR